MTKLISDDARDLIVAEEVTSKAVYERKYQRPEWPGGMSGVTIGIGYDVGAGVATKAQLRDDWGGHIAPEMIAALEPCIGVTGERAHAMFASVRNKVLVPWAAAIAVFDEVDVPRWAGRCRAVLPNFDALPPDCRGALLSLAYNRGTGGFSFSGSNDRYRELRAIRQHMIDKRFDRIPGEFRSMKRIWANTSVRGLVKRREREAELFERGLATTGGKTEVAVEPPIVPKARPTLRKGMTSADVLELQRLLNGKNTQLKPDGEFGTATESAVKRFQQSKGLASDGIVGAMTWAALGA